MPLQTTEATPLDLVLAALTLRAPQTWRGLTVFPLAGERDRAPAYDTFSEARAAGTFHVTEATEHGIVGRLRAHNEGERPVLLLGGEEIVGAKQNRVFNLTIIVPAHAVVDIPVSCVEQGRWHAQSQAFREAGRAMFARGRANQARSITASLRSTGEACGDQGRVWQDVALYMAEVGVHSSTGAMSAAYEANVGALGEYVAAFAPEAGQVGAVFALAGDVVGLEFFDTPAAYRASAGKLVQSYAAELLGRASPDAVPDRDAALALIEEVRRAPVTRHAAVGLGEDLRFDQASLTGGALALDQEIIHFFAFRTAPIAGPPRPQRRETLAQELIRADVMRCADAPVFDTEPPPLARAGLRDRVQGMLLGLAIGDALGNTTEGMLPHERRRRCGEIRDYLPHPHAGNRAVGLPSDDTQLAFWTLRRLLEDGELVPERLARELTSGRIFGIGGTVRGFIRAFRDEGRAWHEAGQPSAGNGALMRIAPVLLPHLAAPSPRLWSDAAVAGMITHNDPASIASCVAFVRLLWDLLGRGRPRRPGELVRAFVRALREVEGDVARYEPRVPGLAGRTTLADFTERQVLAALQREQETVAALDGWHSGAYLLETVPSVLFILERHGHDPAEAIVRAVNDAKDNDTIAALVGAAVGARHGLGALPERWVRGLLGRTAEHDDGEVFRLVSRAADSIGRGDGPVIHD